MAAGAGRSTDIRRVHTSPKIALKQRGRKTNPPDITNSSGRLPRPTPRVRRRVARPRSCQAPNGRRRRTAPRAGAAVRIVGSVDGRHRLLPEHERQGHTHNGRTANKIQGKGVKGPVRVAAWRRAHVRVICMECSRAAAKAADCKARRASCRPGRHNRQGRADEDQAEGKARLQYPRTAEEESRKTLTFPCGRRAQG